MTSISPKIVLDEKGSPVEAIVPWSAFCEIAEAFGWDLDEQTQKQLREVRVQLQAGKDDEFVPLD